MSSRELSTTAPTTATVARNNSFFMSEPPLAGRGSASPWSAGCPRLDCPAVPCHQEPCPLWPPATLPPDWHQAAGLSLVHHPFTFMSALHCLNDICSLHRGAGRRPLCAGREPGARYPPPGADTCPGRSADQPVSSPRRPGVRYGVLHRRL